jgi:hypothetical protein
MICQAANSTAAYLDCNYQLHKNGVSGPELWAWAARLFRRERNIAKLRCDTGVGASNALEDQ